MWAQTDVLMCHINLSPRNADPGQNLEDGEFSTQREVTVLTHSVDVRL
jgi:hypothetical protein